MEKISRGNWRDYAACLGTDPEAFFPEAGGFSRDKAVKICRTCDVSTFCLLEALNQEERVGGIWGGCGELERRQMHKAGRSTWPKVDEEIAA